MEQDFEWVRAIIQSGNNDFHFEAIDNLITLFISKYPDANNQEIELIAVRWETWNKIHGVLK